MVLASFSQWSLLDEVGALEWTRPMLSLTKQLINTPLNKSLTLGVAYFIEINRKQISIPCKLKFIKCLSTALNRSASDSMKDFRFETSSKEIREVGCLLEVLPIASHAQPI